MQCNCGGETTTRTETKNYEVVLYWEQCKACGRCSDKKKPKGSEADRQFKVYDKFNIDGFKK